MLGGRGHFRPWPAVLGCAGAAGDGGLLRCHAGEGVLHRVCGQRWCHAARPRLSRARTRTASWKPGSRPPAARFRRALRAEPPHRRRPAPPRRARYDRRRGLPQGEPRGASSAGLAAAGGDVRVSDDPALIAQADAIVLPGVGAFADAAATMEALGQTEAIRRARGGRRAVPGHLPGRCTCCSKKARKVRRGGRRPVHARCLRGFLPGCVDDACRESDAAGARLQGAARGLEHRGVPPAGQPRNLPPSPPPLRRHRVRARTSTSRTATSRPRGRTLSRAHDAQRDVPVRRWRAATWRSACSSIPRRARTRARRLLRNFVSIANAAAGAAQG